MPGQAAQTWRPVLPSYEFNDAAILYGLLLQTGWLALPALQSAFTLCVIDDQAREENW